MLELINDLLALVMLELPFDHFQKGSSPFPSPFSLLMIDCKAAKVHRAPNCDSLGIPDNATNNIYSLQLQRIQIANSWVKTDF